MCSCASLSEDKAMKLVKRCGIERLRAHTKTYLCRAYPKASRVGSDNLDPMPFWLAGFQLVALNYQSTDLPMILNQGLFLNENGGCGYVLKPGLIRTAFSRASTPRSAQDEREPLEQDLRLELTVLSGHWLPKPSGMPNKQIARPRVRVSLCGAPEDRSVRQTQTDSETGLHPSWKETFVFEISQPSVAMLAFEVLDVNAKGNPDFIAAAAVPVNGLREGVRWVPLQDSRHHAIEFCGILVHARLVCPWAEQQRQQRLTQQPVAPEQAKIICAGPGRLHDSDSALSTSPVSCVPISPSRRLSLEAGSIETVVVVDPFQQTSPASSILADRCQERFSCWRASS